MSTVHETILARHCGLRVAALSAITNLAEGMSDEDLSHEQTLRDAAGAAQNLAPLLSGSSSGSEPERVLVPELIRTKRDGGELGEEEIRFLVEGIADGSVSDAQVGALAMAVVLRGMNAAERVALTGAMTRSGEVLDWSDAGLPGPALDKHSTGGVGDKVSLLLAPIVAACRCRADDLGARARPHGRHARQARVDPRLQHRADPETFRRAVARAELRDRRPDGGAPCSTGACTRSATRPAPWSRSR